MDAHKNFAISAVATAPSPASSGTSLVVTSGHGTRFPATPFNATVWPGDAPADPSNAEIVRVTNISTDTFTITRAQEGSSAKAVQVGDRIAATVTAKVLTDAEVGALVGSLYDSSTRTYTAVNTWEDIANTSINFTAVEGATYLVFFWCIWQPANTGWQHHQIRCVVDGSTTGVTPSALWLLATVNVSGSTNSRFTGSPFFIVTGLSAGTRTLKFQTNDINATFSRTFTGTHVAIVRVV